MKIVAHSVVPPSQPPYQHLGYVSAAPTNESVPLFFFSLIPLVLALIYWKTKWVLSVFFILLTIGGIALSIASYKRGTLQVARSMTIKNATQFLSENDPENKEGKVNSGDEKTKNTVSLPPTLVDSWGRAYRFREYTENGTLYYSLLSAGPDGVFDTSDDIVTKRIIEVPANAETK